MPAEVTSNATRVGTALGLPYPRIDATLGRIERSHSPDDLDARNMNTALWSVGWGYFLSNMIGVEGGMTLPVLNWARTYFIENVRAFGPLPIFRCGPQPYGILPVTLLSQCAPEAGDPMSTQYIWLRDKLMTLRDSVWRNALPAVARIGMRRPDAAHPGVQPQPDADLVDVMRTDGISATYDARSVFGKHFLQHLFLRMTWDGSGPIPTTDAAQTSILGQLAMPNTWTPRLTRLWNAGWQWPLTTPLIQAGEVSPWAKLEPNYITAFTGTLDIASLMKPAPQATPPSLLQSLLRHAYLREIAFASANLQSTDSATVLGLLRDQELIDLVTGAPNTDHWLKQLEKSPAAADNRKIREYLQDATVAPKAETAALANFRSSLAQLKDLDSEALQHLMQGTLDLSGHRLDAWITSFATQRLAAMQVDGPQGQYIGAYGWVENLQPILASRAAPVTTLPAGEPGPLQSATDDRGFIHAPSITHAATAALLRNAHLGATNTPTANDPFAIDLSSRRVREATRLLDGVRNGQPLGALLGYRVERMLHNANVDNTHSLDYLIAPLRQMAPLAPRARNDTEATIAPQLEAIAANNVVDGLILQRLWKDSQSGVLSKLPFRGTGDFYAIQGILNSLNDMVDAMSDALTAETAYQMARGNTSRVASTLASLAQGAAPPPELEVTRVPRTGTALTHRVLSLMSATTNLTTPGWFGGDAGVRSAAERLLNFWAARLLGDATKIRCTVERLDGNVVETRKFGFHELPLTPLDVIYSVEADPTTDAPGEIEQWVLYYSKHKTDGFDASAILRVQHTRPTDLASGEITLFDMLEQARALKKLLTNARGAGPEDLNPPERQAAGTMDLTELESRTVRAENVLNAAHKVLLNLVTKPATATTAETLRTALLKLWSFGLTPSIPVSASGEDPASIAALLRQAQALVRLSVVRFDRMNVLRLLPIATDPRARCDQLIERMRNLFGSSFVVLPRFSIGASAATEMTSALGASLAVQGNDPLAANTWFTRVARVRESLARFGMCLRNSEINGAPTKLTLNVAQLPFVSGERWVALRPAAANQSVTPGKLSLVINTVGTTAFAAGGVLTGLVIDEWTEVVPNAKETTALTFQFDVPDSCAPQCVLVAVPPVRGQDWTVDSLRQLLMETLHLAKLRAVDMGSLGSAAQYLPGLYLAFNTQDHAVSTDFTPLTA
jgi:hypothetical protein